MAEAFLQVLLDNLNSLILKEFVSLLGVDKDLKNLSSTLSTIRAVLQDAEEIQLTDKSLQIWLKKLKDAAYDADDILDECATEASRFEFQRQNSSSAQNQVTTCLSSKCFSPGHILFRRRIANRLKEVKERIDDIAGERIKFHLHEHEVAAERRAGFSRKQQTGSIVTQPEVYGREEDKEKVVECLLNHVTDCPDLSVYPVVGMGGLGKTTLAQLIFNDERICRHFELRIWVCVSDDFDVKRLITAIIESASGTCCETLDMDPLQKRLQGILKGKRFLLVLDDVWSEDQEKWDALKYVLQCGSKGASVVVTTRLKKVASVVRTLPVHDLSCLSEDDCWLLFRQRAFGNDAEERPDLVAIGKEIVKKCGGVPLAAKALGSLMRFKSEENEWLRVKESELWNLPQEENSILPALRLSYSSLPLELRQCFAYCAIFPKDTSIEKERLVLLWMANGFIPSNGRLDMEEVGNEIWNELHWRSFFQDVEENEYGKIVSFKMHDLVHDLAQSVAGDEYYVHSYAKPITFSSRVRHISGKWSDDVESEVFNKLPPLRTVLGLPNRFLTSGLSHIRYSRALVVMGGSIRTKLPSSIGGLKHLKYLDISSNIHLRLLPDSICSLLNLQTLKLSHCRALEKLPKHMSRLRNLRHLCINGSSSLHQTPPNMGRITCLQTLSLFIVERKRGHGLAELQALNLRGVLKIRQLESVQSFGDAKEANLANKPNLSHLALSWSKGSELQGNIEQVLEGLEPHPNLQKLEIGWYKGVNFPEWMKDPRILKNIVSLSLTSCSNCIQLPPLWKLPCLKELWVNEADSLEYVHDEHYHGGREGQKFPCLETFSIRGLQNLKGLSRPEGIDVFGRVGILYISSCPKLMLPSLPLVKDLCLWEPNKMLLSSISNLRGVTALLIHGNEDLDSFPGMMLQDMTVLQSLEVRNFGKLETWNKDPISLGALKTIEIFGCPELESFSEQGLQGLSSLQSLNITGCKKLKSLSEGLKHLTALESLSFQDCPNLVTLPDSIRHLHSLHGLRISGIPFRAYEESCSELTALPEALQHVPALEWMAIVSHPHLASLPDWIGSLTSLQSLDISYCFKLPSLPSSIQRLSNLQRLSIWGCPELRRRCEKEKGEDWPKIAHVPHLNV